MTLKELKKIVDNAYKDKSARNNEIKLWIWDKQDQIGSASFTYECDNITGNEQEKKLIMNFVFVEM